MAAGVVGGFSWMGRWCNLTSSSCTMHGVELLGATVCDKSYKAVWDPATFMGSSCLHGDPLHPGASWS